MWMFVDRYEDDNEEDHFLSTDLYMYCYDQSELIV